MPNHTDKYSLIEEAKIYLRGASYSNDKILKLYTNLESSNQFGYAAEVVNKYLGELEEQGEQITDDSYQVLVKNIYKDTSLSSYFKYDKAINILRSDCELDKTNSCEIAGLAGTIYKHKWKFDHQIQHLYTSLGYSKKGYNLWTQNVISNTDTDNGYTAINYAFISELIVAQFLQHFSNGDAVSEESILRYNNAQNAREKITQAYIKDITSEKPEFINQVKDDWQYAHLAEAFFGLRKYTQALFFIKKFIDKQEVNWKLKAFAQQINDIAHFQNLEKKYSSANGNNFISEELDIKMQHECLIALDKKRYESSSAKGFVEKSVQKKGLAFSGGGFRASLFQIGVLAALAEIDKLRDVEIISCVSGGSIIGAYYYIHLKRLLESKTEDEIDNNDYIKIVKEIEIDFLKAVQTNLRMQIFTNVYDNLKMIFSSKYSRSFRLGFLYEKHFYLPLFNKDKTEKRTELYMSDLMIKPKDAPDFSISQQNWERSNKIPQLILNATCLNTGHNWQFTATWMGEPPAYLSKDFDVKKRLRRMYYKDAPEGYTFFPIGNAVAASSCVPVMFEPLVLKNLYPNIDVELVDGGVHDNQGIASILEQECDCIYICDGSSQLPDDSKTTANEFSLFYRVDNVVQERVRETQLQDLKARKYSSIVTELKIMHLKNELPQEPLSWINCDDEERKIFQNKIKKDDDLLTYGIMKNVQKLLSEVRTDLDSFNDMEAYALMYSGYRQTMTAFKADVTSYTNNWNFLQVEDYCTDPDKKAPLIDQLKISAFVPFKLVKKYKAFQWFLKSLGLVALIIAIKFVIYKWDDDISIKYGAVAFVIATFVLGIFSKFLAKLLDINGYIKKILLLITLATVGWIIFNAYILFFNPWYNSTGKLKPKKQ